MSNKVNQSISSVGIVGCGWLGTALAEQLQEQGVDVVATRSSDDNVNELIEDGIAAEVLILPAEQQSLNQHKVFNQQCVVIAITPQFRQGRVDYADKVQQLVKAAAANNKVQQIILLSSTAVYNGLSGLVDESSILDLTADKVLLLNQAEQAVLTYSQENTTKRAFILRLSGLVGPNRHPGNFLLNGRRLKSPQATVNLIHQKDALGLIIALLDSDLNSGIFNGVSATQVSKKEYYQSAAKALGLSAPRFEGNNFEDERLVTSVSSLKNKLIVKIADKVVSGQKARDLLAYRFVHDDLLHWLTL
ncbi:NAD-binding protein [Colwellia echini]|uniref:NAD(P)H-binding protein n=1 Tax=Colwellia echini TaxID=1982103 RepID=A0ABY3N1H7_9GAMM|nr:NAD(P)H-binding protein [Colwellia echini]TYK67339.1 NAD(P)H-binding protein [Colwellia echini]